MHLGRNALEHEHYAIAPQDAEEIGTLPVPSSCVYDVEAKLRTVEVKTRLEVVDNKERRATVQHGYSTLRGFGSDHSTYYRRSISPPEICGEFAHSDAGQPVVLRYNSLRR